MHIPYFPFQLCAGTVLYAPTKMHPNARLPDLQSKNNLNPFLPHAKMKLSTLILALLIICLRTYNHRDEIFYDN